MDEVDHDQSTDAAQPQLPADLVGGFAVDVEACLFKTGGGRETARVYINGRKRFGAFNGDPAAAGQRHAGGGQALDLVLQIVHVEQHVRTVEQLDPVFRFRH